MNKVINALANALTYDGQLKCASQETEELTLSLPKVINFKLILDKSFYFNEPFYFPTSSFLEQRDIFKMFTTFPEQFLGISLD